MAYRKKTLRSMSPVTRKVARLIGELGSIERRLKNIIPDPAVFDLLYLERDFLNIKLLLKAKFFNLEVDKILSHDTVYPAQKLKEFI